MSGTHISEKEQKSNDRFGLIRVQRYVTFPSSAILKNCDFVILTPCSQHRGRGEKCSFQRLCYPVHTGITTAYSAIKRKSVCTKPQNRHGSAMSILSYKDMTEPIHACTSRNSVLIAGQKGANCRVNGG